MVNGAVQRGDAPVRVGDTVELLPATDESYDTLPSEQIVAASPPDNDAATLRDFVAGAQRVIAGVDALAVEVHACTNLAEFLRSLATLERKSDAEGGFIATVHAFLEPEWIRAEHLSSAGTPLLFERDSPLGARVAKTGIESAAAEKLDAAPALALKLIRREAVEEPLAGKDLLEGAGTADAGASGLASGDADAARRINEVAFAWARKRLHAEHSSASSKHLLCG